MTNLSLMTFVTSLFLTASLLGGQAQAANPEWSIRKTEWSATDEKNFAAFIVAIANSNCHTVDSCIKSASNPYRASDDARWSFASDCGRFPYLLRTYFAWKNGLPMSVVSDVAAVDGLGHDLRYSPKGNYATARLDVLPRPGKPLNGMDGIRQVMSVVNTKTYRYDAERDQASGKFFDFVPAKINRDSIHAGTIIYDANGHAAMVYKVGDDGRVFYMDAHPGNTVSRSVYGEKFVRSSAASGGGFKNFRPLYLTGATRQADGTYVGGRVTSIAMPQIPSFSMEQFYGNPAVTDKTQWKKARFVKDGQPLGFYDYVRTNLAVGDLKYEPVDELTNGMQSLCGDLQDRVIAVTDAIDHGIDDKSQPYQLPDNIYGTSGEWEAFSTPSRDARLKTSFKELRQEIQKYVELYRAGSPRVVYSGTNLVGDLRAAYEASAVACTVDYKRTDGSNVHLTYNEIASRLFAMSFDPYQCVERRWGATSSSELATCRDGGTKQAWYDAEQGLRNQIDRAYDVRMGFTLDQLRAKVPGSGVATPPDTDLRGYLYSL